MERPSDVPLEAALRAAVTREMVALSVCPTGTADCSCSSSSPCAVALRKAVFRITSACSPELIGLSPTQTRGEYEHAFARSDFQLLDTAPARSRRERSSLLPLPRHLTRPEMLTLLREELAFLPPCPPHTPRCGCASGQDRRCDARRDRAFHKFQTTRSRCEPVPRTALFWTMRAHLLAVHCPPGTVNCICPGKPYSFPVTVPESFCTAWVDRALAALRKAHPPQEETDPEPWGVRAQANWEAASWTPVRSVPAPASASAPPTPTASAPPPAGLPGATHALTSAPAVTSWLSHPVPLGSPPVTYQPMLVSPPTSAPPPTPSSAPAGPPQPAPAVPAFAPPALSTATAPIAPGSLSSAPAPSASSGTVPAPEAPAPPALAQAPLHLPPAALPANDPLAPPAPTGPPTSVLAAPVGPASSTAPPAASLSSAAATPAPVTSLPAPLPSDVRWADMVEESDSELSELSSEAKTPGRVLPATRPASSSPPASRLRNRRRQDQ